MRRSRVPESEAHLFQIVRPEAVLVLTARPQRVGKTSGERSLNRAQASVARRRLLATQQRRAARVRPTTCKIAAARAQTGTAARARQQTHRIAGALTRRAALARPIAAVRIPRAEQARWVERAPGTAPPPREERKPPAARQASAAKQQLIQRLRADPRLRAALRRAATKPQPEGAPERAERAREAAARLVTVWRIGLPSPVTCGFLRVAMTPTTAPRRARKRP